MIGDLPPAPWLVPLFTPETPVEFVLAIARAFCSVAPDPALGQEQATLKLNISRKLAVELYRRGAVESEVPWPLVIEQDRIGDQLKLPPLRHPETR